jgi:NAD(P)H-dependent flavin oxidoreductase YrpB (nitropropane dioxygenase family)
MKHPQIIQGGMGVAISTWQLANAVSQAGQLGVVSGTGIGIILIARLMQGDKDGSVRRALSHFPDQDVAQRVLDKFYQPDGMREGQGYYRLPMWTIKPPNWLNQLTVVGNFVEVWLAKEGHNNPVGINLLEKLQMQNMASLYGAMLADVDYVIIGAGIPLQIPGLLDAYVNHEATSYRLDVHNTTPEDDFRIHFDPEDNFPGIMAKVGQLKRPYFFPIISSVVLAQALLKRASGEINGFVIEMPTAGGHNAPPRKNELNEQGEPLYGTKDDVKIERIKKLGLPFWLAGGYGSAEGLQRALDEGAQGIQVGTAFAYTEESGFEENAKQQAISKIQNGEIEIFTSPVASPTGFPFKVVQLEGSISESAIYDSRERLCDVGYLRHLVKRKNGKVTYRCPAEPVDLYVKKGGKAEDTEGRMCLCNQLGAAAGYGNVRKDGYVEPALFTSGDDVVNVGQFIPEGQTSYTAKDVLEALLMPVKEPV